MDVANLASQLNVGVILPEGIVILTLLAVLIVDIIRGRAANAITPLLALGGLGASLVALWLQWDIANPRHFWGALSVIP